MLKRAGYHTAIVGKWHLGLAAPNMPNERGFDHFHGFLGDMMDDYYNHRRHGFNYMRLDDKEIDPEGHATDLFTQWAIDYLRERAGKKGQPRAEGVCPRIAGKMPATQHSRSSCTWPTTRRTRRSSRRRSGSTR